MSSHSEFDNHLTAFRSSSSPLQLPSSLSARTSTTTVGKFTIDSLISSNPGSDRQVKFPNAPYAVVEATLRPRKNNHGRIWSPTVVNDDTSSVSRSATIGLHDADDDVPDLRRRHSTTTAFSPPSTSAGLTHRGGRLSTIWNTWEQQLEESGRHSGSGLVRGENSDHTSTTGFPMVPRYQTGQYDRMLLQSTTSAIATTPVHCLPSLSGEAHQSRPEARSFPHPPSTVADYELTCHRSLRHSHKLVVSGQTTTRTGTDMPSPGAFHRGYGKTVSCYSGIDDERPNIDGGGGECIAAKRSSPSGSSLEAMLPPQCVAHLPLYAVWLLAERGNTYLNSIGPDGTLLYPFHKRKRFRTSFSPQQLVRLEEAFLANQYMIGSERRELAQSLGLSETQIKVWFQNRRTKQKKDGPPDTSACIRRDLLSSSASSSSENGDYIDVDDRSAGNSSPSAVSLSPSSMTLSAGPWLQTY